MGPKIVGDSEGRKTVPSFAGNINIGPVETKPVERENQRLRPTPKTTTSRSPPAPVKRKPIVSTFRQPVQPRQPDSRQPETIVTAAPPAGPTLSLFDRIKARVRGSSTAPTQSPRERAPSLFAEPSPTRARPAANPAPYQANSRFGVFDEVRLAVPGQQQPPNSGQAFSAVPRGSSSPGAAQPYGQPQPYGEFQTVSLQG